MEKENKENGKDIAIRDLKLVSILIQEDKPEAAGINSYGVADENIISLLEQTITALKDKKIIINQIYANGDSLKQQIN